MYKRQVLGLLLRLRGVTCLHASAVALADHAIAFVGSEGAGKSTTAALMARKGCAVISDDVVALVERNGSFYVYPAYPYLCLWPDSVTMVYGPDKQLPSFSPNWDKRLLSLTGNDLRFEAQALPLGAILSLIHISCAGILVVITEFTAPNPVPSLQGDGESG